MTKNQFNDMKYEISEKLKNIDFRSLNNSNMIAICSQMSEQNEIVTFRAKHILTLKMSEIESGLTKES